MRFDTVFIEKNIKNNKNTLNILDKIKFKELIYCEKYSEIFNPKNQNFRIQKINPNIILAEKKKNFILKTPKNFSIGFSENYYFSHMLNCLYDCKYCFLQGMFNSANYLIFVNYEDFLVEIKKILSTTKKRVCFFSGYDCDSLALEKITSFLKNFLKNFKNFHNGFIEIRTKSTKIDFFKNIKPMDNVIIAYSLNPEEIINKFEQKTPSLSKRLESLKMLQKLGWNIGLRFDPLINFIKNREIYNTFFRQVFSKLDTFQIHSVTVGCFRMPNKFLQRLINIRPHDSLIFSQLDKENTSEKEKIKKICKEELERLIDYKKVFFN